MKMKINLLLVLLGSALSIYSQDGQKWMDILLNNYEYPYEVHYFNLKVQQQDLKMAYMDVIPENSNGKNIVLLHGKNFNGAYWRTTIERLSKEGFRVIVPDQVGFGKSSKPQNFNYTFQQLSINTKELLDHIGVRKAIVLGHSMGGMLATRFALMYPETVEKLILENPIGLEDWKLVVPYKPIDWWYQVELNQTYDIIKTYQLDNYYDGHWKPEYEEWVALQAGWILNSDYPRIAWNAALTFDMIFTQPVLYEFGNIKCPTLLIIGTRDKTALGKQLVSNEIASKMGNYKDLGKITAAKIPGAKLVELENVGHLPHIENFDGFIEALIPFINN
jgi:pimeloyl-ACP methyl ester carboxylesterase